MRELDSYYVGLEEASLNLSSIKKKHLST